MVGLVAAGFEDALGWVVAAVGIVEEQTHDGKMFFADGGNFRVGKRGGTLLLNYCWARRVH